MTYNARLTTDSLVVLNDLMEIIFSVRIPENHKGNDDLLLAYFGWKRVSPMDQREKYQTCTVVQTSEVYQ